MKQTNSSEKTSFLKKLPELADRPLFIILTPAFIGAVLFTAIYGVRILDPTYEDWLFDGGDLTQHYLGWLFYRRSEWHFPPGLIGGVLGELKTSVMYTDSYPILAVFFKLLSPLLPETFQYYGFMGLCTFMLNGACSAFLIHRFNKNGIFCIAGSVIYMLFPAILQRMYGHETLACHYIIILGMCMWLYQGHSFGSKRRDIIYPAVLWGILGIIAVGTHLYYLPMLYLFLLGSAITDIAKNKEHLRPLLSFCTITLTSYTTMYLLGAFYNNAVKTADGLGAYSANLNTYWNPMTLINGGLVGYPSKGSIFIEPLPVFDTQYEGYSYLGAGILLAGFYLLCLSLASLIIRKNDRKKELEKLLGKKVWLISFAVIFAVSFFFALSPSAALNDVKIYDIYYPENIRNFMASFRATGRFAWIGGYIIVTAVLYGLSKIRKKWIMLSAIVICAAVQTADISDQLSSRRWYKEKHTYTSILKDPKWEELAEGCDKFVGLSYDQPQPYVHAFSIFAHRHNMTINHFHVARPPMAAIIAQYEQTIAKLKSGDADTHSLYVFISDEYMPDVDGAEVYELDGFHVMRFRDK